MAAPGLSDLFSLSGRTAFVSGAAGHLGSAIATALAELGATVYLNGRRPGPLEELRDVLRSEGLAAEAAPFDVEVDVDAQAFFSHLARQIGKLHVLVNNAYAGATGTIDDFQPASYNRSFGITVTAAARTLHHARGMLRAAAEVTGHASVINIASMYGSVSPDPAIYGESGMNNPPYYGAAKAALVQFTRYAACHLAADKIRVNAISPGAFPPASVSDRHPKFHKRLCRQTPLGRTGQPGELKGAVAFLASDASTYVTGIDLPVDGGWTAW